MPPCRREILVRHTLGSAAFAAVLFGAGALAQSSPVIGAWTIAADTPQGRFETTLTFSQAGGAYVANLAAVAIPEFAPAEDVITDVVIDGDSFSFTRTITTPQGPLQIHYSGTVEGDSLAGEASSAGGAAAITGTRQ